MQILGLNIDREMDSSPVLAGGSAARISAIKTEMQLLQYKNSNTHTHAAVLKWERKVNVAWLLVPDQSTHRVNIQ